MLVGHTLSFVRNPETLINNAFRFFGSNDPFAIVVAGRRTVIIRNVQDVAALWRNTEDLSIDPFVTGVFNSFGMSSIGKFKLLANPQEEVLDEFRAKSLLLQANPHNKPFKDLEREWYVAQLLAPEPLQMLLDKYNEILNESLAWRRLSAAYVLSAAAASVGGGNGGQEAKTVSLQHFCRHTVAHCSITTFFGHKLHEVAPSFERDYEMFEKNSWKIFYRLPPVLAKDTHRAKDRAVDGLVRYFALPQAERHELAWIFHTNTAELQALGVPDRDIAGFIMVIIWAINNNAHRMAFWIFAYLVHNPAYFALVRQEIDAAFASAPSPALANSSSSSSSSSKPDMDVLVSACPHLDGVWFEAMRLYNATSAIREAKHACSIGGKAIHVGDQLIAPFRQFHTNPAIFGADAAVFRPDRFLEDKGLARRKGYSPFGGGHTYCPGRLFAQREIYLLVAATLRRYDVGLVPRRGGARMPEVDRDTPSPAAMSPDEDVLVTLTPRLPQGAGAV
ncbi:cytochrome P450 [Coniella lustricola]|uniref:Cytochrome P450 n=1 Tax=Coniella lustricola TaxID=2025994 RepID=A0A2T3AGD3_9PEZI|nr:cytochrome P450 [Coniella lustricola]